MAKLIADAGDSEINAWDTQRLAELAEQSLDIMKSKKEEGATPREPAFPTNNHCSRRTPRRYRKTCKIDGHRQLINEAQQSRQPIYFLAIHHLDDLSILVTSTTKGRKLGWVLK